MAVSFPLNRRRLLGAASASAALLMVHGTTSHAAQPGGTLVVSLLKDLPTLNPMVRFTANSWRLVPNFYNGLTYFAPSGQLQPDLALSWEAADEARLWTFKLRPGVRFHVIDVVTEILEAEQVLHGPPDDAGHRNLRHHS